MKAFGFDLGTTSSSFSCCHDGKVDTLFIDNQECIPSIVYIDPDDDSRLFGLLAQERLLDQPERVLYGTKPKLGKQAKKEISGENFYSDDVAYELLDFMRRKAKEQIGEDVENAFIALPAYFDEKQRESIKKAAKRAGIDLVGLVSEAQATAIDYCFDKRQRENLMVVDIGSGTFEVVILEIKHNEVELLASGGDDLGGNDIDLILTNFFKENLAKKKIEGGGLDDEIFHQHLMQVAEMVKIELSACHEVQISKKVLGVKLEIKKFKIAQFEQLLQPILTRIVEKIQEVLEASRLSLSRIDEILLTGGSCKHSVIQELIAKNFKNPSLHFNPETSVSRGAAILCHQIVAGTKPPPLAETLSSSIGIGMYDDRQKHLRLIHILKRGKKFPVKGAVIGSTLRGQFRLKLRIWQGENINDIERNRKLGNEIEIKIQKEHIGEENGVVIILQADEGGALKLTAVEIPPTKEMFNDPAFRQMLEFSDKYQGLVQYTDILKLMQKYEFRQHELVLEI